MFSIEYKGLLVIILSVLVVLSLCFLVDQSLHIRTYHTGGVIIVALSIGFIFYTLKVPLWGPSEDDAYKFKKLSGIILLCVGGCLPALHADGLIGRELYETWLLIAITLGNSCFISLWNGGLSQHLVGAAASPIMWAFATHKINAFRYVFKALTGFMSALPNVGLSWSVTVLASSVIWGHYGLKAISA